MYQKQKGCVRKRVGFSALSVRLGLTGSGVHMGHSVTVRGYVTDAQQREQKRYWLI
ncbi:hypothetical protein ACTFR8_24225 [Bacillus cereus group sp. MYBK15-3]|uniref:hypothetical protein n=1 Tax=Bacillus cereus group TaxID=86661 RepID=UPI001C8B89D0|nr:hypothetical protein [Bacillus cereus]MBX9158706.1 hypothetical protein [Bacillus cereus]